MSTPICIKDIEMACGFDNNARCYYMSGADEEQTLSENLQAFKRLRIRPKMLQRIEEVNTSTTILGEQISFPVGISPTGLHCVAHIDGEKATVKAATNHGICMCVSSYSTTSFQDIRNASPDAFLWMQMYVFTDIDFTLKLLRHIEDAGYKAVVLTIDTPIVGAQRERIRHNFILPPNLGAVNLVGMDIIPSISNDKKSELLKNISWDTVDWLRSHTKLPIILKGILTREDAIECLNHDVQGIMVSNHGGRQLDCVPATVSYFFVLLLSFQCLTAKLKYLNGVMVIICVRKTYCVDALNKRRLIIFQFFLF